MSETLSRKIVASTLVIASLGVGACSGSKEQVNPAPSTTPSKPLEQCNGLPPYKIVGRGKEGDPMLQVVDGTTCETGMYDRNTSQGIGASIGPATVFFACVPDQGKPLTFRATVTREDGIGPIGTVNLSYEAMRQWTANQDVPLCTEPEPPILPPSPAPSGGPPVKA